MFENMAQMFGRNGKQSFRLVPESFRTTGAPNNPCVALTNEDIELGDGWSFSNRNYTYEWDVNSRMVKMFKMDAAYLLYAC